jgi:hypothetical protein
MIDISMTTFVDFVAASGPTRLTVVRNAKKAYGRGYDPRTDYWRPLRKGIAEAFAQGYDSDVLAEAMSAVTDEKKIANYRACAAGLDRWAGNRTFSPLSRCKESWTSGDLQLGVNPELCGSIDGTPHAIKLYFKAAPLSKARSDVALGLLEATHGGRDVVGILDVRRSKLFRPTREIDDLDALLSGEAAAFAEIWRKIPDTSPPPES